MSATTTGSRPLTGRAGATVAALGDRARPCDLYDATGAEIYDDITLGDDSELREVLDLLRRRPAGPVLELAAGAGRMTLPLVASGLTVTALDLSPDLLDILRERAAALVPPARARLDAVVGDMADFHLGRSFAVVALGSTSVTLLSPEQRQGLYRCVREHLAPGGAFLVTVPVPSTLADGHADIHRVVTGGSGRRYDMFDGYVPGEPYRTVVVVPRTEDAPDADAAGEPVPVAVSHPLLFDGRVIGEELAAAGFTLVEELPVGDSADLLGGLAQVWEVAP